MNAADIEQFKRRLAERTGLEHSLLERPALTEFVQRRCRDLDLGDLAAYHALLLRNPIELETLVQQVSVPETWLFRYPASFDLLVEHAIRLLSQKRSKLRMLSIACATGEEPYSMAIAAAEAGWPLDRVIVDAVDRHEASLAKAREGFFRDSSFRETMPQWAQHWFHQRQNGSQIDGRIAAAVNFSCHDILNASSPGIKPSYDIVFCRNLFIYLGLPAREKLARLLASVIAADGLLFVGHAEFAILPKETFSSSGVQHAFALRPKRPPPASHSKSVAVRPAMPVSAVGRDRANQPAPATTRSSRPSTKEMHRGDEDRGGSSFEAARAMADAGQLDAAITALEKLGSTQPRADVLDLLGSIHLSLGSLEQARDAFHKALYLEPNHETALLQIAIVYDRLGNTEQSARYRKRAARAHDQQSKETPVRKP